MQTKLSSKATFLLLLMIFIGGYTSLSMELIVLRQLSSFVGTTTITVSIVMGAFLAFMSVGYYHGSILKTNGLCRRRLARDFLYIALQVFLATTFILLDFYFGLFYKAGVTSNIWQTILFSILFLSFGPYLFGKITAVLSRYLHHKNPNYTGKIMAVDTIGSVLGSLLTTLLIMPFIGVNYTIIFVVLVSLCASLLLSPKNCLLYFCGLWLLLATFLFNQNKLLEKVYGIIESNEVSSIAVVSTDNGDSKIMFVNNSPASKVSKKHSLNFAYMNFINDNFIKTLPREEIKDILVVGAGGFSVGEHDSRNRYTYVDIDKNLKNLTEKYFRNQPLTKNKKFVVQDANQFLKESTQQYDVIVLDTYSSKHYIPMELVTAEYFKRAQKNLKEGGILLLNVITSPSFTDEFSKNIDNTLRLVFKNNLRSQVIQSFNAWEPQSQVNVIYAYFKRSNTQKIYDINKNSSFYDYQE